MGNDAAGGDPTESRPPFPPSGADHIRGVKAPGRYDATVGSEPEAREIVRIALPNAVELLPAVAGKPYPSPPPCAKQWYQSHPPDAVPGSGDPDLPHIKYADRTRGKKG